MLKEICKNCQWNNYPNCLGTIEIDGSLMKIDNLRSTFNCGQKDLSIITDFSIKIKSELEIEIEKLKIEIEKLKEVK